MNQIQCNDLLENTLEIGKLMLQSGAEIYKVEDTLSRIFKAYEISKTEIYATTTMIVVTIKTKEGTISTQAIKVGKNSHNLGGFESLNSLSRYICEHKPSIEEMPKMIEKCIKSTQLTNYNGLGYILASGGFSVFFGGTLLDGIVAGIIGGVVYFMDNFFKVEDENRLLITVIMTFIAGVLAIFSVKIGFGDNYDKIIIGVAMIFISTLSLVNGVKDMFYRNIVSGCFRVLESILIAAFIVVGFGLSITLTRGIL